MAIERYPLEEVLNVKRRRVEQAELEVVAKKKALEAEEEALRQREKERDEVLVHKQAKLDQLRAILDEGTTTDKIQQAKVYLKVVDERLAVEQQKVAEQKEKVKAAEERLEEARMLLRRRRQEVDKVLTHKAEWKKEAKKLEEVEEQKVQDEVGTVIFSMHHRHKGSSRG